VDPVVLEYLERLAAERWAQGAFAGRHWDDHRAPHDSDGYRRHLPAGTGVTHLAEPNL